MAKEAKEWHETILVPILLFVVFFVPLAWHFLGLGKMIMMSLPVGVLLALYYAEKELRDSEKKD